MSGKKMKMDYLAEYFSDLLNYDDDDVLSPIDPLSYKSPEGDTCLHIAAIRGGDTAARYLIELGLDVNSCGDMHNTPLHYAVKFGNTSIVDLLLQSGASTDKKNEFGKKPRQNDCTH